MEEYKYMMEEYKYVQTRSETNGIKHFTTLRDAFIEAKQDGTVWKVSFTTITGERCRLVRRSAGGEFCYEPLEAGKDSHLG